MSALVLIWLNQSNKLFKQLSRPDSHGCSLRANPLSVYFVGFWRFCPNPLFAPRFSSENFCFFFLFLFLLQIAKLNKLRLFRWNRCLRNKYLTFARKRVGPPPCVQKWRFAFFRRFSTQSLQACSSRKGSKMSRSNRSKNSSWPVRSEEPKNFSGYSMTNRLTLTMIPSR